MTDKIDPRVLAAADLIEESVVFLSPEDEINFFVAMTGYFADRAVMIRFMYDLGDGDGAS